MTAETHGTDFDDWVVSTYRDVGSFTMLFVLLRIGDTSVDLLRSAYLHVVGDELRCRTWCSFSAAPASTGRAPCSTGLAAKA